MLSRTINHKTGPISNLTGKIDKFCIAQILQLLHPYFSSPRLTSMMQLDIPILDFHQRFTSQRQWLPLWTFTISIKNNQQQLRRSQIELHSSISIQLHSGTFSGQRIPNPRPTTSGYLFGKADTRPVRFIQFGIHNQENLLIPIGTIPILQQERIRIRKGQIGCQSVLFLYLSIPIHKVVIGRFFEQDKPIRKLLEPFNPLAHLAIRLLVMIPPQRKMRQLLDTEQASTLTYKLVQFLQTGRMQQPPRREFHRLFYHNRVVRYAQMPAQSAHPKGNRIRCHACELPPKQR